MLWPLSLCFRRLCREVVVSFIAFWEVMLRGFGRLCREVLVSFIVFWEVKLREVVVSFIVFWEVMLKGCGLFHCVLGRDNLCGHNLPKHNERGHNLST